MKRIDLGPMHLSDDELDRVLGGDRDSGWDNVFEGIGLAAATTIAVATVPHVTIPILIAGAAGYFAAGAELGWGAAQIAEDNANEHKPNADRQGGQSPSSGSGGSAPYVEPYAGEAPSFSTSLTEPLQSYQPEIILEPLESSY